MRHPLRERVNSQMAASSSKGMDVPVGFEGLASMTARVRSVQACATDELSSW